MNAGLLTALSQIAEIEDTFLPLMVKQVKVYRDVPAKVLAIAQVVKSNREIIEADYSLCTAAGEVCVVVKGFVCKRLSSSEAVPQEDEVASAGNNDKDEVSTAHPVGSIAKAEEFIRKQLTPLFKGDLSKVSPERNFMDLGIDSTQLISLVKNLEKATGEEMYPTLFFEYQNIRELSGFLVETYPNLFSADTKRPITHASKTNQPVSVPANGPVESPMVKSSGTQIKPTISPVSFGAPAAIRNKDTTKEPVAIVGMQGVFPGSGDVNQFWDHLYAQSDLVTEIPADHFDYRPWYDPTPQAADKMYCKWGSFIEDVDKFDAPFFNISPREAEVMDPQLRYLLQILYGTAEDAGYVNQIRGTDTGLYVGVCFHDYAQEMAALGHKVNPHEGTGNAATMLANRPSFYFDLTGPSMAIDTACSSSLFAMHTAVRAIQNGECSQAFVAGVNLLLSSHHYRYFCSIGALSSTGRSHTFDSRADGYVPGESIAALLLKPLSQAEADGDRIYGIVKGSAVSHGGYTPSITAPSVDGEVNVLEKAWKDAGISPETLGYVEAHGTGTKLGDPIEVNALKKAFAKHTKAEKTTAIGSAKAHIGHTEGAAGIVGVIKALLSINNKTIPAMPKFEAINPYIKLDESPFYINTKPEEWKSDQNHPRRAGISSFGFGGAYAHMVVEEYPEQLTMGNEQLTKEDTLVIIPLSAKNKDRLKETAKNLLNYLENPITPSHPHPHPTHTLAQLSYTLQTGREAMEERLAIVTNDIEELKTQLINYGENKLDGLFTGNIKKDKPGFVLEGDAGQAYIRTAIEKKQTNALAQLWVNGVAFDWDLFLRRKR